MDEHGRFTIPVESVFSHKVYDSSELGRLGRIGGGVNDVSFGGQWLLGLCVSVYVRLVVLELKAIFYYYFTYLGYF